MENAIDIKKASKILGISCSTIYANPIKYGFVKIGRVWRILPSTIEKKLKPKNNVYRLALSIEKELSCRSTSGKKPTGLIYARQTASELDNLLGQKTKSRP